MNSYVRRLALRNAAKVAFGSLFLQCGGAISTGPTDAEADGNAKPDGKPVDAAVLDVSVPDGALACTGATEVDAGDVTEETLTCCVDVVSNQVGDASLFGDPNGPDASLVTNDPAALNCCNAIIARIDDEPDGGDLSQDYGTATANEVLQWCCQATGTPIGSACTPWGPPTPPAMEIA